MLEQRQRYWTYSGTFQGLANCGKTEDRSKLVQLKKKNMCFPNQQQQTNKRLNHFVHRHRSILARFRQPLLRLQQRKMGRKNRVFSIFSIWSKADIQHIRCQAILIYLLLALKFANTIIFAKAKLVG